MFINQGLFFGLSQELSGFIHLLNFPENTSEHTRLRVDEVIVGTALPVM